MFAWTFLTAGIALGSWWAYRELGWGGWWFWDPVENVALLPWLTGTALFHANLVLRKTGNMPRYVLLLCLICFALSLIGTFLVRSGLLTSVHSFASDPTRGIVICVIMAIIITLAIVAYFRGAGRFEVVKISHFRSKEALILINNLLLLLAMAMIFLATFYPFVLEAINGSRITIGSSYFNEIFAYLMLPTVVACALSNFLVWGENKTAKNSRNKMLVISVESAIITGGASYFLHYVSIMLLLGLWCGIVLLLATGNIAAKLLYLRKLNITNIAVMLGHLGLGLFVICATVFGAFHQSAEFVMQIGDERTAFNDYAITLHNIDFGKGENYLWQRGEVRMLHNNQEIIFYPEERFYEAEQQFSNESAIKVFLTHDWYVTMKRINKVIDKKLDERKKQQYIINIYYNPLMLLLWLSVAMMIIAGIIACINVKKS
jgi:cytochrome c-type biogenesis protein CcmF